MNISDLNISIRDVNAVFRTGCKTVEELRQKLSEDPDGMRRQLGENVIQRVEAELAKTEPEQTPAVIVSEDYTKAITLTRSIIANAQAAQQSLYEVCKGLKEMRDGKLYKELGYQNFADFCETEVGIHRNQAMKYASIAELENAQLTGHFESIGTEKLYLLAKLDEPTREAVTEAVDVESVTVKELKEQIAALTNYKNKQESEIADLAQKLDAAQESIETKNRQFKDAMESKDRQLQSTHKQWVDSQNEVAKLTSKNYDLEEQLKNLESRPVEVSVSEEESKEIERLQSELEDAKLRVAQADKMIAAKVERSAELLRAEYEEKLAKAQNPKPDPHELSKAKYYSLKHIFEEIVDELDDVLDDMPDDMRIPMAKKIIDYCNDELTYLKEKRGT